ncbi:MAG: SapC family protein [Paraglaciecola polaris]|uniref:SapC family protein n=1 Tax=Paraglaciecola polaris TaxID=222814 RepID=UPI00300312EC|tara:strand:- start:526 stop:1290 length:765 start_codon:yes stop_codon:yes gene_type:complete
MITLVELSNAVHKDLKLKENSLSEFAASQQIMRIRVPEVGKSATNFPLFFSRNQHDGSWVLSALSSFEPQQNLFVENGRWNAIYQPTSLQTFPFFLMQSPKHEKSYTIGINESSNVFSKDAGEAVFDDAGRPSQYLSKAKSLLEADIKNDLETYRFVSQVEALGLIKAIDLQLVFEDGRTQNIAGLCTIDEDKMQSLSNEQMITLNKSGYLVALHAMLLSIYQLNLLLRKHNECHTHDKITQLKIEVAKDRVAS